jgi:diguanylate cyclase (GGDEF)-like protein
MSGPRLPAILAVDDSADAAEMLVRLLQAHGYRDVRVAASGEEALALFGLDGGAPEHAAPAVDAVLLDIAMPGLNGIETCRRLKRSPRLRDVPVLMLTGTRDESMVEEAFAAGASDYITKPLQPVVLLARLRSALTLKSELDARRQRERELVRLTDELRHVNDELERLSRVDPLTGAANRRWLDEALAAEWARGTRERTPVALLIVDIDHFKAFNDACGHLRGDECLQRVAAALAGVLRRPADLVARYGGEEFAVVLGNTPRDGALAVAERMRETVAALAIAHPASPLEPRLTVSVGVAALLARPGLAERRLVELADQALYAAKRTGRNRVCVAAEAAAPDVQSAAPRAG